MDEEILKKLEEQDKKLDAIFKSAERTRKYILWAFILSLALIILPLIGLAVVIPKFLSAFNYSQFGL